MDRKHRRQREPLCPKCGNEYWFSPKDAVGVIGPKYPLILHCGHAVCATCLRFQVAKSTNVKCGICSSVSEVDTKEMINEVFPISTFTVGQLFSKKFGSQNTDDMIGFYSHSKKRAPLQNSVQCVECNEAPSECVCRQCNTKLCNRCFDKLHSVGVTLRKHEKVPIDIAVKTIACEEAFCKEHLEKICEYFCENCSKYICDICLRKDHLKHSCVHVGEKNKEIMDQFTEALEEANGVLNQLYAAQKKLKNAKPTFLTKDVNDVEKKVTQHFSQLHGVLQILEEGVMKEIRAIKIGTRNASTDMLDKIETNIQEMETILAQGKSLDEFGYSSFPLHGMLEKMKNISAMPCMLVENDAQGPANFEFSTDPAIIKQLKEHCNLVLPSAKTYEIIPKLDLQDGDPKDKPIKALSQDFISDKISSLEKALSKPIINNKPPVLPQTEVKTKKTSYQDILKKQRQSLEKIKISDVMSSTLPDNDIISISSIAPLTIGTTEVVTLCHLVSPSDFYVQRKCAQSPLQKVMEHFSQQANIKRQPPENVQLEHMYLAFFHSDKKWYRAIVKKINENNIYDVFYVDYGNTEQVDITKLRDISQHYVHFPGQAIHCCLHSCFSAESNWSEDAVKLMAVMTDGVEFSMYIEEITSLTPFLPNIHQVHLRSVDDTILSVADVLVFLGHAHISEDAVTEDMMFKLLFTSSNKNIKSYFKDVSLKKGDIFDSHVTHVNSPSHFYIQKLSGNEQQLINLMKDLKQAYSSLGPDDQLVLSPIPGLPVAAKFQDGDWYRGIVLQVVKVCQVQVQYVDFGNIECVKWKDIRTLQPKFLRMSMQGIKCALSDITPKHPKGWSVPAKKAFENMAKKETLFRVFVDSVEQNQLNVVLYNIEYDRDICFNGLMVKKGHANSVGPSSIKAVIMHGVDNSSDKNDKSPNSSVRSSLVSKSNTQNRIVKMLKSSLEDDTAQAHSIMKYTDIDYLSITDTIDGFMPNEEASRLKVKVLKVVNPGELYITFEETYKKIMAQSMKMTGFYKSTDVEDKTWKVGDLCAVLRLKDNKWHRGLIQSCISSNRYKVFIKDIVDIVEVDISGLRSLDPMFTLLMDGSIKCHLSGILPTSGGVLWSQHAIEHLKVLSADLSAEYFINKMGDLVNDSLPIQFWRKRYVTGGALDPVREDWMDLSQELFNNGFVLPDTKSKHYAQMKSRASFDDNPPNPSAIKWLHENYEKAAMSPFVSDLEKDIAAEKVARSNSRKIGVNPFSDITSWKPAVPLKALDLLVNPSYIDYDCVIYIQTEENQKTLELIKSSLHTVFHGSIAKPHDLKWSKGEICIAFFNASLESGWYRGEVKKVLPEHIEVLFVDYGNVENLQPEELRKQIAVGNIPIQCHRCIMEGVIPVSPDEKWPLKTLDFIHGTIVSQKCRVILKSSSSTGLYTIINFIVPCGEGLIELLASMNFVNYTIDCDKLCNNNNIKELEAEPTDVLDKLSDISSGTTPIVPETQNLPVIDWFDIGFPQEDSQNTLAYKDLVLPDSVVELPIEVTTVSTSSLSVNIIIVDCEDPEVMCLIGEFENMHRQLQEDAENMPAIKSPTIGLPCVGCYSEDNTWYRALIKEIFYQEKKVMVLYVDYGNMEKLSIDRLKTIKKEWLEIPMMSLRVELFNLCHGPNYDKASVENLMEGCLKTPPYIMSIVTRQPSFQVDLFNADGELAYQTLINLGLLAKMIDT